ncbi:hypothetical protein BBC0122_002150 [Bartonella choladocola]|uniref:Uncharacterized protein n=2 Tax=Bartonella choladocola TaxID=2750995 RepID=A0A1U9MEJ6_9HYPH|nr:hypothetical protein BBC0122_002150 [Bartonella choladocola]
MVNDQAVDEYEIAGVVIRWQELEIARYFSRKEKGRAGGDAQPLIPNAAMGGGGAAFNLLDLGGGVIQQEERYCMRPQTTTHNYA